MFQMWIMPFSQMLEINGGGDLNFPEGHTAKQNKSRSKFQMPNLLLWKKKIKKKWLDYSHLWSLQHLGNKETEMRTVEKK